MDSVLENEKENSAIPQSVRDDYNKWLENGDDALLSRLIAHIFRKLEIVNYESAIKAKGDAAAFSADLGVDSLTLTEILFYTEDILSIRISNEDVSKLVTVGDLKAYISEQRGKCKAK